MGRELPLETRFAAEELYVTSSMSFEEISRATGVSVSRLRHWADEHGWRQARREYRQAFADIKRRTVELRRRLVHKALESLQPMDVFAVSALEKLALAAAKASDGAPPVPAPESDAEGEGGAPAVRTAAEAAAALRSAAERKLHRMLVQPEALNLAAVRELRQILDLIDKMQAQAAPAAEGAANAERVLSEEAIRSIREQLKL